MLTHEAREFLLLQDKYQKECREWDPLPSWEDDGRVETQGLSMAAPPTSPITQRFVVTTDPQFPRLKSGAGEGTVAKTDKEREFARNTILAQYQAVNTYRNVNGGFDKVPVFIDGDISEGDRDHTIQAYTLLKSFEKNYYPGLGNHDMELFDYAFDGTRRVNNMLYFLQHCEMIGIDPEYYEEGSGNITYQKWKGTFTYYKDIGPFRFIMLHMYPSFTKYSHTIINLEKKEIDVQSSMDWLENVLKDAVAHHQATIICLHQEDKNPGPYLALCKKYNVSIEFYGHIHDLGSGMRSGIPWVRAGSSFTKEFVVCEYHASTNDLAIYFARNNAIDRTTSIVTKPVFPPLPEPFAFVTRQSGSEVFVRFLWKKDTYSQQLNCVLVGNGRTRDMTVTASDGFLRIGDLVPEATYVFTVHAFGQGKSPSVRYEIAGWNPAPTAQVTWENQGIVGDVTWPPLAVSANVGINGPPDSDRQFKISRDEGFNVQGLRRIYHNVTLSFNNSKGEVGDTSQYQVYATPLPSPDAEVTWSNNAILARIDWPAMADGALAIISGSHAFEKKITIKSGSRLDVQGVPPGRYDVDLCFQDMLGDAGPVVRYVVTTPLPAMTATVSRSNSTPDIVYISCEWNNAPHIERIRCTITGGAQVFTKKWRRPSWILQDIDPSLDYEFAFQYEGYGLEGPVFRCYLAAVLGQPSTELT